MFLKLLILRGFKTFADTTEIEFSPEDRITAIVGPNGCGKSNLMDATRWVLGEDNPRELRVASLANIIFSGTAARKALSLAEVSMIFDNAAGKLSLPFAEVGIKRRTFREGESEFSINKNQCRLKDIKDLLLDTGLGESTYSIITQGRVDAILSSKGEDRRAVFEEAAGINKYKTRKHSAEKKLIAAEQNILRISDLKIEVAEHLITLEEQARAAREYLALQEQVRNMDIGLSKKLLINILEKRNELFAQLEKVRQESQQKKEAEARDEGELHQLKEQQGRLEQEIDEIMVKLDKEKDQLRDIELDRRFTQSEHGREERALAELAVRQTDVFNKINELKAAITKECAGLDFSNLPCPEDLSRLVAETKVLVERLAAILAFLGKTNSLDLIIGRSPDKEEAYKMKLEMMEEEARRLEQEKDRVSFAAQAHSSQLAGLNQKAKQARAAQSSLDLINTKREAKSALARQIAELEEKLRQEDQVERRSLSEETGIEIALAKLEGEMSGIRERLSLEYNLSLEELEKMPQEIENVTQARRAIESGRGRLRALEPVNLLAIDEFEREKERLSFIEAQLADLNAARDNLQSLITELDLKAEQTFIETMDRLSEIFSETFSKLFAGGEARISLATGVPALEAEVEISVRPNGRKWLPLPQLSGGERSLSAIAILFSLLKIRPSPFCFMDEVDAALDDANIGRFAEMLKDFSSQTQIIVITHNKRTMAVADSIYGVTMEEPGVSKVISMKLTEAAA
ncbi:MAG: AAA family ATPase [Candidatus Saganbacteria bacterium]|nr:AAA family ATPase [Candidatus Saganbacteria bacterium]